MRRLLPVSIVAGALLFLSALLAHGQPGKEGTPKKANYYPLQVGNEWRFRTTVGDKSVTAVSRIAKVEIIDGMPLARLEAYLNDKLVATEHLQQTEKGIFRHRNNGQEISPPICLLKYPVAAGAKWKGDLSVGKEKGSFECETKEEMVEVPAGKFKAIRVAVKVESMGQVVNTVYWFVQDMGFVKQTAEVPGFTVLMELEKFSMAKKSPPAK